MRLGRKISSGKYHRLRKRKKYEKHGQETQVILDKETKRKTRRVTGGNTKTILLKTNQVNIFSKGKAQRAEIINVSETPQNKFWARQNRLTKGAVIETSLGKARITNRPSQEGHVNAILLSEND